MNTERIAVMPLHDPDGQLFPHLEKSVPQLERLFGETIIRVTTPTVQAQAEWVNWLERQSFFYTIHNGSSNAVGEQFCELYAAAASRYAPDHILHLCFPDRVAYALQNEVREQFVADVQATSLADLPLLYQRTKKAWETHPTNYRVIESLATQIGELLFKRSLDLTWCHMAMRTQQLQQVLPHIVHSDLSVLAEIVVHYADQITTMDVDWLAWEDPFITGREAASLKYERENSLGETRKRLSYVIPTIRLLADSLQV